MNDTVTVKVSIQGSAVPGEHGYLLKRGDNVAAFYLDGWGETGRIYPVCTSSSVWEGDSHHNYPSITLEDGSDYENLTEIYFPTFKGWHVHSVSGGKTMAICLTKDNSDEST